MLIITLFLIPSPNLLRAQKSDTIYFDKPTLKKGYIFKTKDQNLIFILQPETFKEEVKLSVENLDKEGCKIPKDKNLISNLYAFDLKIKRNTNSFESPKELDFSRSFDLILKYKTRNNSLKNLYLYNPRLNKWSKVATFKINLEKKTIQVKLKIPYAQIVILEEKPLFGIASWFPTRLTPRNPLGCASNYYPLGTKLRVINLANNKSLITTVISRGPYVKGRIIDLTGRAFSKIANIRQGLIKVKVERLN